MARNVIESYLRTSKMAGGHFVNKFRMDLKWPEMPSKVNFGHQKWAINLKWPEMRSKVIFRYPKWPAKKKILYQSEMTRIAIEYEFRKSKMADRSEMARNASKVNFGHPKWPTAAILSKKIKKKLKLRIDLKWPKMRSKVNFGHPKWPTSAILSKISNTNKVAYRCEMDRNEIKSDFQTSKMATAAIL